MQHQQKDMCLAGALWAAFLRRISVGIETHGQWHTDTLAGVSQLPAGGPPAPSVVGPRVHSEGGTQAASRARALLWGLEGSQETLLVHTGANSPEKDEHLPGVTQ